MIFVVPNSFLFIVDQCNDYHEFNVVIIPAFSSLRVGHSGVLIYKTVSDRLITREQPREMGFIGRTAFSGSKFIYLSSFKAKKLLPLFSSIY